MGEFEPLTEEQVLASSVRTAYDPQAHVDDAPSRAVSARKRQMFHRDDLESLKQQGCLGESYNAQIVKRACKGNSDLAQLIAQENQDRDTIIDWIIAQHPTLTVKDKPQIVALYHEMLIQQAKEGDWLEVTLDHWVRK
jgi:uncharacterized protein YdbL (DUF1318 family)